LLDLVGFRLPAFRLKVQDFFDPLFGKDVVTATDTLRKTQTPKQATEPIKGDVRVRRST
jgi:hypothetical protein